MSLGTWPFRQEASGALFGFSFFCSYFRRNSKPQLFYDLLVVSN